MSDDKITSTLGKDEALVLFEPLADFHRHSTLEIPSAAERLALVRLSGALEKTLVEPFGVDYQESIRNARSRLIQQSGQG